MSQPYTQTDVDVDENRHAIILEDEDSVEIVAWDDRENGESYCVYDKGTGETTYQKFP